MFGLFGSRTKRKVLQLERIMMSMETAARKKELRALYVGMHEQVNVMRWLHDNGDWSKDEIMEFIFKRGLVRSLHDRELNDYMQEISFAAEEKFGVIGINI